MNIVLGRGNRRQVTQIPTGKGIAEYAKTNPNDYHLSLATVCDILRIPCS